MVSTPVVVLVLLHLHASNTLRKDEEDTGINVSSSPNTHLVRQPTGDSDILYDQRKRTQVDHLREDEDLLDLMVRIAETPAEWERMHRVFSQLGAEQNTHQKSNIHGISPKSKDQTNETLSGSKRPDIHNKTQKYNKILITPPPIYKTTEINSINDIMKAHKNTPNTDVKPGADTGWPDFNEAIAKKIKKRHKVRQESNLVEEDWFQDDNLDSTWNSFFGSQNQREANGDKAPRSESPKEYQKVSFKPTSAKGSLSNTKDPHIIRSRIFTDANIVEFPLNAHIENHTLNNLPEEVNKSSRPVFLYHRVTTSPQEQKGNNAFIAVSVVKQNPVELSATEHPSKVDTWSSLTIPQIQRSTEEEFHKNNRWSNKGHYHHKRGHRRHHSHTHGQP